MPRVWASPNRAGHGARATAMKRAGAGRAKLPVAKGKKPIFDRGQHELTHALAEAQHVSGPGPQPTYGPLAIATKPEWYVYWALDVVLKKRPGVDFLYRGMVPDVSTLALKAQLDFTMLDGTFIAIEVQGIHWHYALGTPKIAEDVIRRALIQSAGWQVIFIDEDDALRNPEFYVREALAGRDHSYRYEPNLTRPS